MGNPQLLIDRYDCRGALMDISRYEPGSSYHHDETINNSSSEYYELVGSGSPRSADALEKELDEERYKDLNEDVDYDERAFQREEEYKRLQTAMNGIISESKGGGSNNTRNYNAFQYEYNEKNHDICIGPEPKKLHEEDSPYVKPVGLYIPEEIALPKTMKNHAIIEKTAKFIASQGNQMEIILKTKQAGNPLFDFLNHKGTLNPYYKFIVHAIRTGIYRPPVEDDSANSVHDCSGSEEDADHTYLHPSLFRANNSLSSSLTLDAFAAFTSANAATAPPRHNAYTMLVSKIKGTDSPDNVSSAYNNNTTTLSSSSQVGGIPPDPYQVNSSYTNTFGYKLASALSSTQSITQPPQQQQRPQKQLPSIQDQLIIEKMASYVIKNGANFEVLAKTKGDPRFSFLNPSHEYHWYYLNCKERFKAESSAVVASSEFVTYSKSQSPTGSGTSTTTTTSTAPSTSYVKKSAAAELAELKRKNLSSKKSISEQLTKDSKSGVGGATALPAESVFSQASLVKDKDKPVIRFSSSLSLNTLTSGSGSTAALGELSSDPLEEGEINLSSAKIKDSTSRALSPLNSPPPMESDNEDDKNGCTSPFDDTGGGNTTPASDDEEQIKRRLERKRKAALFLQKLSMKTAGTSTLLIPPKIEKSETDQRKSQDCSKTPQPSRTQEVSSSNSLGTSLGDLLNRRLQGESQESRMATGNAFYEPSDDATEFHEGTKSSSSSHRRSSRSRSRSHVPSSRSRRTYSSSSSSSGGGTGTHYSKKKSSKRKHKKKKKKHEKSSRSSSRKSKRRK
ncbi:Splicing factor, suppressor of white-apricot [Orchesella cincta]|uniref:Splicing factor, suppressor of white-apricot n=1 Tax=Orchesella cincta TaxID=48709 RepID=A0A1D2MW48_ORCCI|nr:Splicing factor, suppressor of white-apricot [Orchesella cincta]